MAPGSLTASQLSSSTPIGLLMLAYTHYENDPRVIRAAEAALEGGVSVDVIGLKRPGQPAVETIRGVRVFRIQERYRGSSLLRYLGEYGKFFFRCMGKATRLFLKHRYKVIHVHNMPDALVFAALVPKLLGAKVVLDIHDPMPETYGSKYRNLDQNVVSRMLLVQEKLAVAFADRTVTVSDPVKTGILIKHGYRSEAIDVVANFADDRIFEPMRPASLDGPIRFVFHGTILERYGLRTLIEAVRLICGREKLQVRIIGEGDFSRELARLIRVHDLGGTVEFMNRVYPLHEIPGLLSDCHVGLVPLNVGGSEVANFALPLKLGEYTCLGMPCITVRNAAIEYYFRPDECMFFESGDAGGLAKWLSTVAENPECLMGYREKLKEVRQRMLWSKEKQKYLSILTSLAVGSPG